MINLSAFGKIPFVSSGNGNYGVTHRKDSEKPVVGKRRFVRSYRLAKPDTVGRAFGSADGEYVPAERAERRGDRVFFYVVIE